MAKKRKTLPKDFKELLTNGDIGKLIEVFDKCELNAYENYSKKTALGFDKCPDELAKWLVDNGADIQANDRWGRTPLHNRSRSIFGNIKSLLDLGAKVNDKGDCHETPLHSAALSHNVSNTKILIDYGADINGVNAQGYIPLELALRVCRNIDIKNTVELSKIYFGLGNKPKPQMKEFVNSIGKEFEFHRANFNKEYVDEVSNALDELYKLYNVIPVSNRRMHDGKSKIIVQSKSWKKQHQELWELLVPGSASAQTIQGEVIRISGKVTDELERNGGGNWDSDYNKMVNSFINFIQTREQLSNSEINELKELKQEIKKNNVDTMEMCELSVKWVLKNPNPVVLPNVEYAR